MELKRKPFFSEILAVQSLRYFKDFIKVCEISFSKLPNIIFKELSEEEKHQFIVTREGMILKNNSATWNRIVAFCRYHYYKLYFKENKTFFIIVFLSI